MTMEKIRINLEKCAANFTDFSYIIVPVTKNHLDLQLILLTKNNTKAYSELKTLSNKRGSDFP